MKLTTLIGIAILVLFGCNKADVVDDIRAELECQTKWTDVNGKSHCDHLKLLVFGQYTVDTIPVMLAGKHVDDSLVRDTTSRYYRCVDSTCIITDTLGVVTAGQFQISARAWTIAR